MPGRRRTAPRRGEPAADPLLVVPRTSELTLGGTWMLNPRGKGGFDGFLRYVAVVFVGVVLAVVAANTLLPGAGEPARTDETVPNSAFVAEVAQSRVVRATLDG